MKAIYNISKMMRPASRLITNSTKKSPGMIGVIGSDPLLVAEFNTAMVKCGNDMGLSQDQQHPEALVVAVRPSGIEDLGDQITVCKDAGCDHFVLVGDLGNSNLDKKIEQKFDVSVYSSRGNDNAMMAQKLIEDAIQNNKTRRKTFVYDSDQPWQEQQKKVEDALRLDKINRTKRVRTTRARSGYPLLRGGFVGVVGGAGPLASAIYLENMVKAGIPAIEFRVSGAPGKHFYEIGEGPSYINHYKNAVDFFGEIGASSLVIPCNTAHKRLSEFCTREVDLEKVISIPRATLEGNRNAEGFILLGTSRTTGVGLPNKEDGVYEVERRKYPEQGPFFLPTEQQQAEITKAIFEVKAGKFFEAKTKILQVIGEMRAEHGRHMPVILGCTELPLAGFAELELLDAGYIDPMTCVVREARGRMSGLVGHKESKTDIGLKVEEALQPKEEVEPNILKESKVADNLQNESPSVITKTKSVLNLSSSSPSPFLDR